MPGTAEALLALANRIERAGKIERGEIRFDRCDAGYYSILKAFYPKDREMMVAALRWQATEPDLLGALRGIVAAFVNPGDGGEFERGEVPALDVARDAIAKASNG